MSQLKCCFLFLPSKNLRNGYTSALVNCQKHDVHERDVFCIWHCAMYDVVLLFAFCFSIFMFVFFAHMTLV